MSRRRRGGFSLTGLLIIGAILYFTGAGAWLWERTKQLPEACYGLLQQSGMSAGEAVCEGLASGIAALDNGFSGLRDRLPGGGGDSIGGDRIADMGSYAQSLLERVSRGNGSLAGLTSSGQRLRELMNQQPIVLPSAVNAKERMRMALDQFVIGQHYLQSGASRQAMPWLQNSARQPGGYGVLSQLTLGDMYRTGSYGVGENNPLARNYYGQAVQSITSLQSANTPESRQLLASLPVAPNQLISQLTHQIKQMTPH